MTALTLFCDRLAATPGDHSCELDPGHAEACTCECGACEVLVSAMPQALLTR